MVVKRQSNNSGVVPMLLAHGVHWLYWAATAMILIGVLRGQTSIASYFSLIKSKHILEETVQNLQNENEKLSEEITRIKESKSYARKVLREKYHVTEEGEKIIYYAD